MWKFKNPINRKILGFTNHFCNPYSQLNKIVFKIYFTTIDISTRLACCAEDFVSSPLNDVRIRL